MKIPSGLVLQKMPVYKADFRVLVLSDQAAPTEELKVTAICLEQNLVGTGATVRDALWSLTRAVSLATAEEFTRSIPAYQADPDPEVVRVFEDPSATELEGMPILRRLKATSVLPLKPVCADGQDDAPEVTFEECVLA